MSGILVGSGWHPRLFQAEMQELLPTTELFQISDNKRILHSSEVIDSELNHLKNSATLDTYLYPADWVEYESEKELVNELVTNFGTWAKSSEVEQERDNKAKAAIRWSRIGSKGKGHSGVEFASKLCHVSSSKTLLNLLFIR